MRRYAGHIAPALIVALLALARLAPAQPAMPAPEQAPSTLYDKANTAGSEAYLTESEKTVVLLINLARMDGSYFTAHYLPLYKDTGCAAYHALKAKLATQPHVQALVPVYGLARSAALQATENGIAGRTGTAMADGAPFQDRIHRQMPGAATYASAYYLGSGDPLELVLGLLVGEKDSALTYQRMLLSSKLDMIGVSIRPHKLKCSNTLIDMAKRAPAPTATAQAKKHKDQNLYFMDCPKGAKVIRAKKPHGKLLGWLF